jgi:hypothetical protein
MTDLLLAIVVLIILAGVIYVLERRLKTRGALFAGQAALFIRMIAVVLGILFMGLCILELNSSETMEIWFPILAVALIGYGLGAGRLLDGIQGRSFDGKSAAQTAEALYQNQSHIPESRGKSPRMEFPIGGVLRFLIALAIVIAVSATALCGAGWAAAHPNEPFGIAFVVGIIVLAVPAYIFHGYELLRCFFQVILICAQMEAHRSYGPGEHG